jgi:hypothetical protein
MKTDDPLSRKRKGKRKRKKPFSSPCPTPFLSKAISNPLHWVSISRGPHESFVTIYYYIRHVIH